MIKTSTFLTLVFIGSCSDSTNFSTHSKRESTRQDSNASSLKVKNTVTAPKASEEKPLVEVFNGIDPGKVFIPTESGLMFGDIAIDPKAITYFGKPETNGLYAAQSAINLGVGIQSKSWPAGSLVFSAPSSTANEINLILDACNEWAKTANITCKMRTNEANFIRVYHDRPGCNASLGMVDRDEPSNDITKFASKAGIKIAEYFKFTRNESYINLQRGIYCFERDTLIHEVGHLLGLIHEHQRPDRNNFVDIAKEKFNQLSDTFNIEWTLDVTANRSAKYDFNSIMHYPTLNGAIKPKSAYSDRIATMGRGDLPTELDRQVVEMIYGRKEIIPPNVEVVDSETGRKQEYKPVNNDNTKPVYRGYGGSKNGFIWSASKETASNGGYNLNGVAFHIFETPGTGRTGLYDCYFGGGRHFATTDPKCAGHNFSGIIGYVYISQNSKAKNKIYLCYNGYSHLVTINRQECVNAKYNYIGELDAFVP